MVVRRSKVLIVDDDMRFRQRVKQLLACESAVEIIGEAGDGEEAILKAREYRPDLVLMDIRMPGMNGLESIRCLNAEMPDLKVIILTALDLQEYREAAIASGASGFVPKRNVRTELLPMLSALRNPPGELSRAEPNL
jgi:DNA-binding NarL/FixJ family response regulator